MCAISAWALILSGTYFFTLKRFGLLRVPIIYEIVGLDYIEHGGPAAKQRND